FHLLFLLFPTRRSSDLCLILGLAIAIERIIYLNLSTTNTKKLIGDVEDALNSGGVDAAKEVARNTAGPVASIFYQGLDRYSHGLDRKSTRLNSSHVKIS